MPIVARCPSPGCRGSYRVPDDRAGQPIRCPLCRKTFTPAIELPPDPVPPPAVPTPPSGALHFDPELLASISRSGETAKKSSPSVSLSSSSSSLVIEQVGRFIVLGKLGAGAFGTVYKARDPQLERDVALKVPNAGMLDTPKRVERFLREAQAAAQLRHPNIVPVFDAGMDGDRYYIASAFVDGQPLSDAIGERGVEFRSAAEIVRILAQAIGYAHDQGIVHRDIKPANVMLDSRGQPHLMDFGLAARADEMEKLTNDGAVLGTPAYMAPEQATGQKGEASPLSDQYALGAVLYELMTGEAPFNGPPAAVIYKVLNHEPTPPHKIRGPYTPRDLETICMKAMAKKPESRYPDCHALAGDLQYWLDGEPIEARRQTIPERVVRWVNKNRAVAASLAVTVASLAIGTALAISAATRANEHARMSEDALNEAEEARRDAEDARHKSDEIAKENEKLIRDSLGIRGLKLSQKELSDVVARREAEVEKLKTKITELLAQGNNSGPNASVVNDEAAKLQSKIDELKHDLKDKESRLANINAPAELMGLRRPEYFANLLARIETIDPSSTLPIPAQREELLSFVPETHRKWEWHYLKTASSRSNWIPLALGAGAYRQAMIAPNGNAVFALVKTGNRFDVAPVANSIAFQAHYPLAAAFNSFSIEEDGSRGALYSSKPLVTSFLIANKNLTYDGEYPGNFAVSSQLILSSNMRHLAYVYNQTSMRVMPTQVSKKDLFVEGPNANQTKPFPSIRAISDDGSCVASNNMLYSLQGGMSASSFRNTDDNFSSVRFSPRATWLAYAVPGTSAESNKISLCDVKHPALPAIIFSGHSGKISAIGFTADESRMATAGEDGTLKIWDTATQECLLTFKTSAGTTSRIVQLVFSSDGLRLVALSNDMKYRIWAAATAPKN